MKNLLLLFFLIPTMQYGQESFSINQASKLLELIEDRPNMDDSTLLLINKAIKLVPNDHALASQQLLSELLFQKSNWEYRRSDYQQAITNGLESLSLAETIKNDQLLQKINYHLGSCYTKIGSDLSTLDTEDSKKQHLEKSKIYLLNSLKLARKLRDSLLIIQTTSGIANLYLSQQEYDSAEIYCKEILNHVSVGNHKTISVTLNHLGIIAYQRGFFNKAENYFLNSIQEAKQVPKSLTLLSAMGNLANTYMEQKRYELAKKGLYNLINLNKEAERKQALSKNYITLHNLYKRQKIYDSALFYYEKYFATRDSILSDQHKSALQELEIKYEAEKKDKEIQALSLTNAIKEGDIRKKDFWLVSIGAIALLIAFGLISYYQQRSLKQKELNAQMQQQLLTAQMNPHFLFNALNSIQRLYVDGHIEEGNIFMSNFAQFVRDILNKTGRTRIPLTEEVEFLEAYLKLEKKRLGDKFDYQIIISEDLKNSIIEVPSLISQPLVENSLIHGILTKKTKGFIEINVSQNTDGLITFIVKDDGIGYETSLDRKGKKSHQSKGISLIRSRLGRKGKLIIESFRDQSGTKAILQFQAE